MKKTLTTLFLILSFNAFSQTITTNGMNFSPDTLTVIVGDTITFNLSNSHNAVEVDQSVWNANNSASNGGFNIGFGQTGVFVPVLAQTYYYVCQPHVGMGMKGVIIAQSTNVDCNGIANGSSMMDSCGVCQQSYIYDFMTHNVTMLDDTFGITLGATEILVMANDPQNPYWNSLAIISYDTIISNTSITWNGIYLVTSGDYIDSSLTSLSGCDSIANLNFTLNNISGLENQQKNIEVIKVVDILGRKNNSLTNNILLYIYKDGTVRKKIIFE